MLTIMLPAWQEACDRRWSSFVIFPGLTEQRRNRPPTVRHDGPPNGWLSVWAGLARCIAPVTAGTECGGGSKSQSGMHLGRCDHQLISEVIIRLRVKSSLSYRDCRTAYQVFSHLVVFWSSHRAFLS
jgi:hypothetical protein